jgi:hypothetical protein
MVYKIAEALGSHNRLFTNLSPDYPIIHICIKQKKTGPLLREPVI